MGSPSLLIVPNTGKELILYLAILPIAVRSMLVKEEDKVPRSVYYVSKVLLGAETKHLKIKKLAFVLIMQQEKSTTIFQAHPIAIFIDQPLKQIL